MSQHARASRQVGLRLASASLLALAIPRPAEPQSAPARISGRVIDKSSAHVVAGADITLGTGGRGIATDSAGGYAIGEIPSGTVRLLVRAFPYRPTSVVLEVKPGDDLRLIIELDSTANGREPTVLPAVAVSAVAPEVNRRLLDFDRRRRTGRGQYLSDDEIRSSGASTLQDAMRGMRGVAEHCGGSSLGSTECRIQMVRAPPNCSPEYIVDERADNIFGPSTPIRDIMALEVYTGPSDVPGEFAGRNAGCGVIVIWTRAGPPRRP